MKTLIISFVGDALADGSGHGMGVGVVCAGCVGAEHGALATGMLAAEP